MNWSEYDSLSPKEALTHQKELRDRLQLKPLEKPITTIAGADVSFNKFSPIIYAGIIVLSYPSMEEIERVTVISTVRFPYVPGLLAYREIPPLMEAWEKLKTKPDLLVCDGQGYAHPRRMGIASHFGIIENLPTIGCGKTKLVGAYEEPDNEALSQSVLTDKDETIGVVLRTKKNCRPVFISPGNLITIDQSVEIIKNCIGKYRIPEPTRRAHLLVNEVRAKDMTARAGL